MKKMKFRNEIKHYINLSDYYSIKNKLKYFAELDKYSLSDGKYLITSVYFDTPSNKALMEKLNGIMHREKFRIRYYNNDRNFIKLEKKSKVKNLTSKEAIRISDNECLRIFDNDIDWMIHSSRPLINELYIKMKNQILKPKTIVEYLREAYVYQPGNVRITIDSDVRTCLFTKNLLSQKLNTMPIDYENKIILEVKYDEFLPSIIRDLIQTNERRQSAISKYASSRIYG
jgi:hypothetical protein